MRRKRRARNIDQKVLDGYFPSAYIGHLIPEEVKALSGTLRITVEQLSTELLAVARRRAIVPLSGYKVGVVCRGESGSLYLGANIEFKGGTPQSTLHAEQVALSYALSKGETGVKALTVSAAPCGHCRQFINELADSEDITIHIQGRDPVLFTELLPFQFGPEDLNVGQKLMSHSSSELRLEIKPEKEIVEQALLAANKSYAPYSDVQAAAAFQTRDGKVYTGFYVENAAYNPCILPAQAAVANLIMSGRQFSEITKVVIVQKESSNLDLISSSKRLAGSLTSSPIETYTVFSGQ